MSLGTYNSLRKSYYYKFFPVKDDEYSPDMNPLGIHRTLVEIRDVYPPPQINPHNPWNVRKILSHDEVASGMINVHFNDAFDHILRYWNLSMAAHIALWRRKVNVILWDVTDERSPKKFDGFRVYFQMITREGNCVLSCEDVIKDRSLKAGDDVGLYWVPRHAFFCFKLLSDP